VHVKAFPTKLACLHNTASFPIVEQQRQLLSNECQIPPWQREIQRVFLLHPISNNQDLQDKVAIGCTICTTHKLSNLSVSMDPTNSMLPWLKEHQVHYYGHLWRQHYPDGWEPDQYSLPNHPLKLPLWIIIDALQWVVIIPDEVTALDAGAKDSYEYLMYSSNELTTYVPPFEVFPSHPGIDSGKTQVITAGIRTKSMLAHKMHS